MTVRLESAITFGPGDFFRTDRGVTWGIKVTDTADWSFVSICTLIDGVWSIDGREEAQLEPDLVQGIKNYGNDVQTWYQLKMIPALNRWLKLLPEEGAVMPIGTIAQQVDKMIQGIKITVSADGTLTAI